VIRNNNNDGTNGGRGIYTDGGITGGSLRNVTVDANNFVNNRGGADTTFLEAAIAIQARTTLQTDIRITNNYFELNGKAVLAYNAENLTIAGTAAAPGPWTLPRVLELFPRLAQRLDHRGDELSGGEQQMLAIGRALMTNPRLLLLDEATEGLAPLLREEIWRTIRLIRTTGMTTLIIDKTVAAVTAIADRIIILVKGEIVFQGRPDELKAQPDLMHRHLGV